MRKIRYFLLVLLSFSLLSVSGCSSRQVKKDYGRSGTPAFVPGGPLYAGEAGRSIRLAVLRPGGVGLTENELWLPAFIQGVLASDFEKHSAMTVSSRQAADAASSSGNASANAGADLSKAEHDRIGRELNVNHILSGRLRKTSATEYLIQLTVTDISSGVQKAVYSKEVTAFLLRDSSAIREAALEILTRLEIELTEDGRKSLQHINLEEREGAVALAKGISAEQSGNQIEMLSHLYSAVSYDSSLSEAVNRLEVFNKTFEGGLGDLIQNDYDARNFWAKMISDFEEFYTKHPPFELLFTPRPEQKGSTNYRTAEVNLGFEVRFRESPELDGMRQVLKIITGGLARTGRQREWDLGNWPYSAGLFDGFRNFVFKAELVNDNGNSLQTVTFNMPARLFVTRSDILPDTAQKKELVFNRLKLDSLTSNPRVRIVSVDGIDAEQSGQDGYVNIMPVEKLPAAYPRSLLVFLTRSPSDNP
jgi:hypothetical protein